MGEGREICMGLRNYHFDKNSSGVHRLKPHGVRVDDSMMKGQINPCELDTKIKCNKKIKKKNLISIQVM